MKGQTTETSVDIRQKFAYHGRTDEMDVDLINSAMWAGHCGLCFEATARRLRAGPTRNAWPCVYCRVTEFARSRRNMDPRKFARMLESARYMNSSFCKGLWGAYITQNCDRNTLAWLITMLQGMRTDTFWRTHND